MTGRPSGFHPEQRVRLVDAWKASGKSAREFAAGIHGLKPGLLHNWSWRATKKTAPAPQEETGYRVVVAVDIDADTHANLVRGALNLSRGAKRLVPVEEYAASILRNFLAPRRSVTPTQPRRA